MIVVYTSDGHSLWVPKGVNALEMKLLAEKTMLWCQILGHISEKGLRDLKNKILVEGIDDCNLEFNFVNIVFMVNKSLSFYSNSHKTYG